MNQTYLLAVILLSLMASVSRAQVFRNIPRVCEADLSAPLSAERIQARKLFQAITGTPLPMCDPRIQRMEIYLANNQRGAAIKTAITDPLFHNIRLRDFATKFCSRNATLRTEPNDCVAFVVGFTRDSLPLTQLLTANYFYKIDLNKIDPRYQSRINRNSMVSDILRSNRHFEQINDQQLSMFHVLSRSEGQMIVDQFDDDRARPAVDPAGVITSRAFMEAHATAGTNRRLVEKAFESFLCSPITEWADNSISDRYVGRDVTRSPGKSPAKYHVTCKGCHSPMDSMRGAFARVNFDRGYFEYNLTGIEEKMNRNLDTTPDLYFLVMDDSFDNLATENSNSSKFGWNGATSGRGMKEFGNMLAQSNKFLECMAQRAAESICTRSPSLSTSDIVQIADVLRLDPATNLRSVFQSVAEHPNCLAL